MPPVYVDHKMLISSFFKDFIYLRERDSMSERERERKKERERMSRKQGRAEGGGQADSPLSRESLGA